MNEQAEFLGGPVAGRRRPLAGMSEIVAVSVDAAFNYLPQGESFAVALYRRQTDEDGVSYHFLRFERPNKNPFEVEFADGPHQGTHFCSQPPHFHEREVLVPLTEKGCVFRGDGQPSSVAVYRAKTTSGKWWFHLDRIEDSGKTLERIRAEINERRALHAISRFYLSPDCSIYSNPPTDEHHQVFIECGDRRACVDEGIAPLIQAIWKIGLETLGSCQERPSGKAYVGFPLGKQGGLFHKKLIEASIDSQCEKKKFSIRNRDSGETIEIDAANVSFSPKDIPAITKMINRPSG